VVRRARLRYSGPVGKRGFVVGAALVSVLVAQASAETGLGVAAPARSAAYGIKILLPNADPIVAGAVSGPPSTYESAGGFAYPADGSVVRAASVSARATTSPRGLRALAGSDLRTVVLFGGEVTVDAVVARSAAVASGGTVDSSTGATQITGLVALGQPVTPSGGLRVQLADWGHLTLLQENERAFGRFQRGWITAVDVRLDADHAGLPVGTRIIVGYAETTARAQSVAKTRGADKRLATRPRVAPSIPAAAPRPRITRGLDLPMGTRGPGTKGTLPLVLVPPKVTSRLTKRGYVFPVFGPVSYGDSFGAPRADTIWHHGADIFAPLGAPILAVADGTVFSVGRNRLGGNRFWLRDLAGNEFYYAHLSAFAPAAINGNHVRAGDVIGFVGNTGDADGTPYHLHFEVHPASMLVLGEDGVINPTPFLQAWQRLTDVAFPTSGVWAPTVVASRNAPAVGAILLQSSDISSASGLDPGSLARALRPVPVVRDGVFVARGERRAGATR
jgi:murein DD-endopeptidase MepM/ murein hydrolase activator NlpD